MTPETISAIKEALTPIAAKIGQGATYSWEVVVRQQYISGTITLLESIFWIATAIAGIFWFKWAMKRDMSDYADMNVQGIVAGVLIAFSCLGVLWCVEDGIQHILNPAYYAFDFFIHLGSPNNP